jgi:excisionase family DNA binding protein
VHLHVVIRLDRAMPAYRAHEHHPPPARFDAELLECALRATVDAVSAPLPAELGGGRIRWGRELDVRRLGDGQVRGEIAGYLAKYATKSTEEAGGVLHRVTEHQLDELPVSEHVRAYLRAAFALAAYPALADRRLAALAHTLGYRGHCLTKSRRLLHHLQSPARSARGATCTISCSPAPVTRCSARSRPPSSGARASATSVRATSQPPTLIWRRRRPLGRARSAGSRARNAVASPRTSAWQVRDVDGRAGLMTNGEASIQALAKVMLDLNSLDAAAIERLAELVAARIAGERESPAERLLSVGAVAELTGLSRSLVSREIERGRLPAYKVGTRLRIEPAAVEDWKARCQVRPRSEPPVYEPVMRGRRARGSSAFVAQLDAIERDAGRAA